MLAKLDDLKTWLKITDVNDDLILTSLLRSESLRFERACDRYLERRTRRELYWNRKSNTISLDAYPVTAVTSVKEIFSTPLDWENTPSLIEDEDYRLDRESGLLTRIGGGWTGSLASQQVIWTGGYAPAGETPNEGETEMPADIQNAVLEQCRFLWLRRNDIGLQNVGMGGGSWSISNGEEWIATVKAVIKAYRRYA